MSLNLEFLSLILGLVSLTVSLWKLFSLIQAIKLEVINNRHDIQINSLSTNSFNTRLDSHLRETEIRLEAIEKRVRQIENFLVKNNGFILRD